MRKGIEIFPDAQALASAAAEYLVSCAQAAVDARGICSLVLAGGETPRLTYQRLAAAPLASRLDWSRVHLFWGDERCVPPDHPESNYRMAREALIDHVPLPPENIHRMHGELPPEDAAVAYECALRDFFTAHGSDEPRFDVILLGMGEDGHTASLFPHTLALREQERWAVAQFIPAKNQWRITLTPHVINAAAHIALLVSGGGKAERLQRVLSGPFQPDEQPVQLIHPRHGELHWLIDAAAGVNIA